MSNENQNQWQTNLLNVNVWLRLVFMLFAFICLWIARIILGVVVILQFLLVLIAGHDNDNLRNFGQGLSKWVHQCLLFVTFNSEEKPFPFNEWPTVEPTEPYQAPEVESKPEPQSQPEPAPADPEPTYEGGEAEVELDDEPVAAAGDVPSFTEDKPAKPSPEQQSPEQEGSEQQGSNQEGSTEKR
ncbi:DUF4389 domain-containing protein [Porticoccus sp. W117]|uniref:DUF4389 domain-containing protein n=1 Tax=Porticoccus sp. W117 TaxID=3054777 RepID=UPI0025931D17|nr:DUF4389 domain-containing protein [Porticoccus sp. W117]MDM3869735.1 DUF4389 domain-containing protein [Porticoccus sp. W117]